MTVSRRIAVLAIVGVLTLAAHADLKITTKNTMAGQTSQGTTYIKGQRQRTEQQFGPMKQVTITQCDKRQSVTISDACRTYMVNPIDQDMEGNQAPPPNSRDEMQSGPTRKGGTMTINVSSTNTGETQPLFGYTARHIKTRMNISSSPDACNPSNMSMESDGWYTDFAGAGLSCSAMPRPQGMGGRSHADCQDRIRFTGNMRNNGYPMKLTTTMNTDRGTFTMTQETTELSRANLNPALFDVPAGYRQVSDYQGLMCQAAYTGGGNTPNIPEEAEGPPPPDTTQNRRHGSGALCVAPVTNKSDASFDSEMWRDMLIGQLARVRIQAVKLQSTEQFDLRKEAYQQGCHLVLYTDVNEAHSAGPGRHVGRPDYRSSLHVTLMPDDDYQPWLDSDVQGTAASLDSSADSAMRSEAQQVATELAQHR
jgi:hypothetical protein